MDTIPKHCPRRIVGIPPDWNDIPLLQIRHLGSTSEVTTLVEFQSPSSNSPLVDIEVIEKSLLPHFNPPLPDTLDHVL